MDSATTTKGPSRRQVALAEKLHERGRQDGLSARDPDRSEQSPDYLVGYREGQAERAEKHDRLDEIVRRQAAMARSLPHPPPKFMGKACPETVKRAVDAFQCDVCGAHVEAGETGHVHHESGAQFCSAECAEGSATETAEVI